jgi:hypothetical protein
MKDFILLSLSFPLGSVVINCHPVRLFQILFKAPFPEDMLILRLAEMISDIRPDASYNNCTYVALKLLDFAITSPTSFSVFFSTK